MAYKDITIEEDNRELYDNLYEIYDYFPDKDDFEIGSEWNWNLDCTDGDGDSYFWRIEGWFDPGDPSFVKLTLTRTYLASACWKKNPSHCVINLAYECEDDFYPSNYDEIVWELIEELREIFNEYA